MSFHSVHATLKAADFAKTDFGKSQGKSRGQNSSGFVVVVPHRVAAVRLSAAEIRGKRLRILELPRGDGAQCGTAATAGGDEAGLGHVGADATGGHEAPAIATRPRTHTHAPAVPESVPGRLESSTNLDLASHHPTVLCVLCCLALTAPVLCVLCVLYSLR